MTLPEPATGRSDIVETEVGSVFVSNYPPYSAWSPSHLPALKKVLASAGDQNADLGLYVHIPFCRKRCKFCYFKVYTGKNSNEIKTYMAGLLKEVDTYASKPVFKDRPLRFVYFGGGTPSYLSVAQLRDLVSGLRKRFDWEQLEEFSFECEPGTLTKPKVYALKDLGVTRLSLGVENFDDEILSNNGRAHVTTEIDRVLPWIKDADFPMFNLDLIAGMVGETSEKWSKTIDRTIEVAPDSVTIYQMELPFNTVYSSAIRDGDDHEHFANWSTKRRWNQEAMERLEEAGYVRSSAYTMVKMEKKGRPFVYRDALWRGADMMGTGVASFSHVGGIHYQNLSSWGEYLETIDRGELPLQRALETSNEDRFIRQFILQMKLGELHVAHFVDKFGMNPVKKFEHELSQLRERDFLTFDDERIQLTMKGLMQVDTLLPNFYDAPYKGARYT